MNTPPGNRTRQQTLIWVIITMLASLVVVWLLIANAGDDPSPTSTTHATDPDPNGATTTVLETTTTSVPDPTTTLGVFDEVAAVVAFIEEFAAAIAEGDPVFLFDSLHPAVKATYEEEVCRSYIDDQVLRVENYRQIGPVVGPFDSEFGEFPITSYEAEVAFDLEGEPSETTAVFSLTEGVVRWLVECS